MTTIIKNGHVYDTALKRFSKKDIEIRDGIIVSVRENIPCDGVTVDCEGKYVIPGLVDVHTHGRAGCDFNTADAGQCLYMRRKYAQAGTTTVMATLASAPMEAFLDSAEAVGKNRDETPGLCTITGIHLEGRYLNPKRRGAHAPELLHKRNETVHIRSVLFCVDRCYIFITDHSLHVVRRQQLVIPHVISFHTHECCPVICL